jgi:hypothetical protein
MKVPGLACWLVIAAALVGAYSRAADADSTLAQSTLEWVKLRAETSRVETDWANQRELLKSTVKAFEERANEFEAKRDLLKAKTAKERGEMEELELDNRRLGEQLRSLESHLHSVGDRLVAMRRRLPPKLSQALELPLRSLADPNLTPTERAAHTMTVLNRCMLFNRCITFGEEVVDAPGEAKPKLLQTVYWGLSHGYAYDKVTHKAWIGAPVTDAWQWTACHESEGSIRELIAMFDDKAEPRFVSVPATAGAVIETKANP